MKLLQKLPRLVLIGDGFTAAAIAERILAAVAGGVQWVHLRDHDAEPAAFELAAQALVPRLREVAAEVLISINTQTEVAKSLGVGLHAGHRGPSVEAARRQMGEETIVGYSAHTVEAAQATVRAGADYLFYSPIFPTGSKPGHNGLGLEALRTVCETVTPVPVFALGGITPAHIAGCLAAGVHGIAILSGILHATNATTAAQEYLNTLK